MREPNAAAGTMRISCRLKRDPTNGTVGMHSNLAFDAKRRNA